VLSFIFREKKYVFHNRHVIALRATMFMIFHEAAIKAGIFSTSEANKGTKGDIKIMFNSIRIINFNATLNSA
jgi:hypothetical protein